MCISPCLSMPGVRGCPPFCLPTDWTACESCVWGGESGGNGCPKNLLIFWVRVRFPSAALKRFASAAASRPQCITRFSPYKSAGLVYPTPLPPRQRACGPLCGALYNGIFWSKIACCHQARCSLIALVHESPCVIPRRCL